MKDSAPAGLTAFRSACPIASSLDILGDRWTMVIIRDLFGGACRYNDFLASPERITTNILADRLKTLEIEGLVSRTPYQHKPLRWEYRLTPMGRALRPVLDALLAWNMDWIPDRQSRVKPQHTGTHPWRLPPAPES